MELPPQVAARAGDGPSRRQRRTRRTNYFFGSILGTLILYVFGYLLLSVELVAVVGNECGFRCSFCGNWIITYKLVFIFVMKISYLTLV